MYCFRTMITPVLFLFLLQWIYLIVLDHLISYLFHSKWYNDICIVWRCKFSWTLSVVFVWCSLNLPPSELSINWATFCGIWFAFFVSICAIEFNLRHCQCISRHDFARMCLGLATSSTSHYFLLFSVSSINFLVNLLIDWLIWLHQLSSPSVCISFFDVNPCEAVGVVVCLFFFQVMPTYDTRPTLGFKKSGVFAKKMRYDLLQVLVWLWQCY